ncbi:MAG: hypothetical protein HQM14_00685 [SAR324 cluster bacterium]|nr:hypothetical protein [SAR324 cluster bacterium]
MSIPQIKEMIARWDCQLTKEQLAMLSEQNTSDNAEWHYRLGNLFYEANAPAQAKAAWEKSVILQKPSQSLHVPFSRSRSVLWHTIFLTIGILFSLYCLVILLFPRENNPNQLLMSMSTGQQQQEPSWWDDFWSTGRPAKPRYALEEGELWSILHRQVEDFLDLFSSTEKPAGNLEERLTEWLNHYRNQQLPIRNLQGKSNYYYLAGKGFFSLKQYTEAINALEQGLEETKSSREKGMILQEIATIYYYQGYQLQPDGLAKYNTDLVRKSVETYKQAQQYIQDAYLYGNLGWGYYLLADYKESVRYSKKALKLNPQLSYVQMNMGIAYLRTHNYHKAFQAYENLLHHSPHTIDYIGGLRDLEELVRDFKGQYPFAHFIFGYIYYHQENFQKARQSWNYFLKQPFPDRYWKQKTRQLLEKMQP